MRIVDAEIAAVLATVSIPSEPLDHSNLGEARAQNAALTSSFHLSDAVERHDHVVPGPDGEVVLRVHRPVGVDGPLPCVYAIHGGGYVLGSYRMEDHRFDTWCTELGLVGVAVDYRLAPETPYPGPLEDCYAGLRWIFEHAVELGIDADRIGLLGTSAGGGLAAALALLARDRGEVTPAFQLLLYPMLDDREITPSSSMDVPIWGPGRNRFGWRAYLGDLAGSDDVPPYAAPARATDLRGLPPASVWVGTVDIFCDEDIAYAQALIDAGVPTELHVYAGGPHGFDGIAPGSSLGGRCRREIEAWLTAMTRERANPATP